MATRFPLLFSPIRIGPVELRNRIVQTGHVTGMALDGLPTEQLRAYYRERARGGVGMLITEAGSVHPTAAHMANVVRLYQEPIVEAYRDIVADLHAADCRFVAQLWHAGNNSVSLATDRAPWAPSAIAGVLNHEIAHAVTRTEIGELVSAFGEAAARASRAGVDGVEIHAGHGYLLQQFLSPATNHRTDEYGGGLENRARFVLEVLAAVREAVGPDRIIGVRISAEEGTPGGQTLADSIAAAQLLVSTGAVSYLSVSFGNYGNMEIQTAPMGMPHGHLAHYAADVRRAVPGVPVLAVGRITTPQLAEKILADGSADLIGLARGLMADAEFARKAQHGREDEIRPCVGTNHCQSRLWAGQHLSCIYNPVAGRERELGGGVPPAKRALRVTVVGGGPAGLEAARVAVLRGHAVTLLERGDELGGQLGLAARVASRAEMRGIVTWLVREVERLGVDVRIGTEATVAGLQLGTPDVVVLATGSRARALGFTALRPDLEGIPGIETAHALTGRDALASPETVGQRVLLVDLEGHVQGLTVGEHLVDLGREVELVTQLPFAGARVGGTAWARLMQDAARKDVRFSPGSLVERVEGRSAWVLDLFSGRSTTREGIDTVVIVGDSVAEDALADPLGDAGMRVVAVGDCVSPRHLEVAILEAHRAARAL